VSPPYPAKEQSLPEKLALAREDAENWAQVAATPNLSPKAAAWAQGIVRSSKAAVSLYEKAMAFQQEQNGQAGIAIERAWENAEATPISLTLSPVVGEVAHNSANADDGRKPGLLVPGDSFVHKGRPTENLSSPKFCVFPWRRRG
jgi:hypothetical protein